MKKSMIIALAVLALSACSNSSGPQEDVRLQQAWETCIQTAEGSPEKLKACESMPKTAAEARQRESVAAETISPEQYQKCIKARKSGNDQAVADTCEKIWQESHAINP